MYVSPNVRTKKSYLASAQVRYLSTLEGTNMADDLGIYGDSKREQREGQRYEKQFLKPQHADAIVEQMFRWMVDEPITNEQRRQERMSTIACIVCDATHANIEVQPLHDAYARAKQKRGL